MYPPSEQLARDLSLANVEVFESVGSTLDVAHERATAGAAAGTLILAGRQTAGRGRQGRAWSSQRGAGIWLTLIERPRDRAAIEVLSLRIGIAIAQALEPLTGEPIGLKWPNDIYRNDRKLAGILVEARWRGAEPDWVAIGVGLNVLSPDDQPRAIGLEGTGVDRDQALGAIVPAIRHAAFATGPLAPGELDDFRSRDIARDRVIVAPVTGRVQGIDSSGSLVVLTEHGVETLKAGSLVFEGDQ